MIQYVGVLHYSQCSINIIWENATNAKKGRFNSNRSPKSKLLSRSKKMIYSEVKTIKKLMSKKAPTDTTTTTNNPKEVK